MDIDEAPGLKMLAARAAAIAVFIITIGLLANVLETWRG